MKTVTTIWSGNTASRKLFQVDGANGSHPPETAQATLRDDLPNELSVGPGRYRSPAPSTKERRGWAPGDLRPWSVSMPPAYVKPYVKRHKNDATEAEAICEAVTRPNMRLFATKPTERQSA